ncbi:hypothetical protein [Phycicoccus flavus]|uniref:hypothetical protein n=1 Tax=Phycicoccus flavus TaxID=2502783 RepID=UPI000FEBC1D9|nr:hypothetical protein [Phycicoccus flavus]NHA69446.1 hypothetical protein [Phycicoccus flavus]
MSEARGTVTRAVRERGAGALEYVGAALIAGVVIASVVLVVSPVSVTVQIQRAWCLITSGQECPGGSGPDVDAALPDCETTNTAYKGEVEGTAFSVNLGVNGSATIAQVRKADGDTKYTVSFAGGGKAGAHVMFGEKGEFGLGEGLSAGAKAAFTANGGVTFEFDSQEAANQFVKDTAVELAKRSASSTTGFASPLVKWGLDKVTGTSYDPPPPTSYYVELGTKGSADAGASAGLSAKVGVDTSQALGVKVTPGRTPGESASYTYYFKASDSLVGELGLAGKGSAEGQVALTFKDGQATSAQIDVAGDLTSSILGGGKVGQGIPFGPNAIAKTKLGITPSAVVKGKATLKLDLTNPDNMNAVADVLNSTGLPVLPNSGTGTNPNPVDAVSALADRFTQAGPLGGASFTAQQFEGESGELSVGAFAGDLLAFGAGGKVSVTQLDATNAAFYDPAVGGMVLWRRCGG